MSARPPVRLTSLALIVGTAASVTLLLLGLGLALVAQPSVAQLASSLGVVALIVTPAIGLAATVVELWRPQPSVARAAVVVLGVLAVAAVAAMLSG